MTSSAGAVLWDGVTRGSSSYGCAGDRRFLILMTGEMCLLIKMDNRVKT